MNPKLSRLLPVLTLLACGSGVEALNSTAEALQAPPMHVSVGRSLEDALNEKKAAHRSPLVVTVSGLPDGATVEAISGMMSCGFAEMGVGRGTASNGQAIIHLRHTGYGAEDDMGPLLYLLVRSADGTCDIANIKETALEPGVRTLTMDWTAASTPEWFGCDFFERPSP